MLLSNYFFLIEDIDNRKIIFLKAELVFAVVTDEDRSEFSITTIGENKIRTTRECARNILLGRSISISAIKKELDPNLEVASRLIKEVGL
jgi:hypothetical protein